MPMRTVREIVAITNGQAEESHLKITLELELNINLNSNGLQATVTTKDVKTEQETKKIESKEDEGFGGFVVPTFEPSKDKVDFGKTVNVEESNTVNQWAGNGSDVWPELNSKNRKRKEEK